VAQGRTKAFPQKMTTEVRRATLEIISETPYGPPISIIILKRYVIITVRVPDIWALDLDHGLNLDEYEPDWLNMPQAERPYAMTEWRKINLLFSIEDIFTKAVIVLAENGKSPYWSLTSCGVVDNQGSGDHGCSSLNHICDVYDAAAPKIIQQKQR
jgi:hypothetical protein